MPARRPRNSSGMVWFQIVEAEDAADHVGRPRQGQAGEDAQTFGMTAASATAAPHTIAATMTPSLAGGRGCPAGGDRGDQRADGGGREEQALRLGDASSSARNG